MAKGPRSVIRETSGCWLCKDKREEGGDIFSIVLVCTFLSFLSGFSPSPFSTILFPKRYGNRRWLGSILCPDPMRLQTRENKIKPNFRSNWLKLGVGIRAQESQGWKSLTKDLSVWQSFGHTRIKPWLGGAECRASIIQQRTMTRLPFGDFDLPHSRSLPKCTWDPNAIHIGKGGYA